MSSLKNFYDAFGYVVVRNVYDKEMESGLRTAYDAQVTSYFGKSIEEFLANPTPVPSGVERSQELLNFVQNSRILPMVEELVGDDALFWNSDLSTFTGPSQFHRDTLGDYRVLKVGIYLQNSTAQDGGQFCCIPGSHHFGDSYSRFCSHGLMWPHGAGYADNVWSGEYDGKNGLLRGNLPALGIELGVGDAIFFNQGLVHGVRASSRPRRMIALSFFEGEKSFNSRPRAPGEFAELNYSETVAALRLAGNIVERARGRNPDLNYNEQLRGFDIKKLSKYLKEFTVDEYEEINARVFKNSYEAVHRFIFKSNPA